MNGQPASSTSGGSLTKERLFPAVVDDARSLSVADLVAILEHQESYGRPGTAMLLIVYLVCAATVVGLWLVTGSMFAIVLGSPISLLVATFMYVRKRRTLLVEQLGVTPSVMKQISRATIRLWRDGRLKGIARDRVKLAEEIHRQLQDT